MKEVNQDFQKDFELSEVYNASGKNVDRASIIETNQEALDTRLKMINEAEEKIVLTTFNIREGKSTDDIFASLLDAANRGIKIQILVDGLCGRAHMSGKPIFLSAGSHPNIEIRFYNIPGLIKPWTINGRLHDKIMIADDKLALLGGRNTFDYFLGDYQNKNESYDREVLIFNTAFGKESNNTSVIEEIVDYVNTLWDSSDCETVLDKVKKKESQEIADILEELELHFLALKQNRPEIYDKKIDFFDITLPVENITLIANPIHIYAKEPYVWYQLVEAMKHAKSRVVIQTPYAVFSNDMYNDMARIHDNQIDFRMLINAVAVGDNFVASSDYTFNRDKVLETGVTVYEFQGEHSSHGKSILIDDNISIIGSYNLDIRSTYISTESMVVIYGEEFNQSLEEKMMAFQEQSLKVTKGGVYEENQEIEAVELKTFKKIIFKITSVVAQLFRYLI